MGSLVLTQLLVENGPNVDRKKIPLVLSLERISRFNMFAFQLHKLWKQHELVCSTGPKSDFSPYNISSIRSFFGQPLLMKMLKIEWIFRRKHEFQGNNFYTMQLSNKLRRKRRDRKKPEELALTKQLPPTVPSKQPKSSYFVPSKVFARN
jgi:hypothetical protein